nr:immunoglobulin light chain junction region [Macaca mulatta]
CQHHSNWPQRTF